MQGLLFSFLGHGCFGNLLPELIHLGSLIVEQGVITGTSGRYGQILKLRPPLVFSRDDADRTVAAIDAALAQLEL